MSRRRNLYVERTSLSVPEWTESPSADQLTEMLTEGWYLQVLHGIEGDAGMPQSPTGRGILVLNRIVRDGLGALGIRE